MTSEGWARVNRMYDLGHMPEPNSPLESVFDMLFQLRQEAKYMEHLLLIRAILDAPLQTEEGVQTGNEVEKLLDNYTKALFPFHDADRKRDMDDMKEQLKRWVEAVDNIKIQPMPSLTERAQAARRMRRGLEQQRKADIALSGLVRRKM